MILANALLWTFITTCGVIGSIILFHVFMQFSFNNLNVQKAFVYIAKLVAGLFLIILAWFMIIEFGGF